VEQLAPFPLAEISALLKNYPALEEVRWVQEEPENMGAWDFVRLALEHAVGKVPLCLVSRPRSASPAEGSSALHAHNQSRLIERAYA
jgi:2-oxoglutarate dehydrogenase E1 component